MSDSPHIVELDESNFVDVVVEGSMRAPVLVDFWADWCGPCKSLMPILEKLAIEFAGGFTLAKLDTEAHPHIAQQLGIRSLPTVKLFNQGQLADEFMGALPEAEVRAFLANHCQPAMGEDNAEEAMSPDLERAMAMHEAGDSAGAAALLKQAQANDPEDATILLALGQVSVATGDFETATSCLDALPEETREDVAGKRLAGTLSLAREAKDLDPIDALQATVANNPHNLQATYDLAIATAAQGKLQGAMDQLLAIVQKDATFDDGAARKKLLSLFDVLGDDPLTGQYRRKLFAMLH